MSKGQKRGASSLLSFGDAEGGDDEFFVKKPKKKERLHKLSKEKKAVETQQSNSYLASSAGTYSDNALDDLRKNSFHWG